MIDDNFRSQLLKYEEKITAPYDYKEEYEGLYHDIQENMMEERKENQI